MSFICGTGSDVCSGKTGKYKIQYTTPSPGKLTYRYEGEDWNEIIGEGLTYTFELTDPPFSGGQCLGTRYYCTIEFFNPSTGSWRTASTKSGFNLTMYAPISGWELIPLDGGYVPPRYHVAANGRDASGNPVKHLFRWNGTGAITYNGQHNQSRTAVDLKNFKVVFDDSNQQDTGTCGDPPGDCIFKVFKDGAVVHEETRSACPEVMQTDCLIEDNAEEIILINTDPDIALNIVETTTDNINSTTIELNGVIIKKLDSPVGCNLYPKVCYDCDFSNSCPLETCEVDCGTHVCCYNAEGKAVYSYNK